MDLNRLKQMVSQCKNCELCHTRKHTVFGKGNEKAKLMFIGEGPGYYEDQSGVPFVGNAGKLLDNMLAAISLSLDDVYIANIVKCRPPQNRNPYPKEEEACLPYLRQQVKLIEPQIMVCLGSVAAKRIIDPSFSVTRSHGLWVEKGKFWITATYHPSALLRFPDKKKEAWSDLKKIREKYDQCTNKSDEPQIK